MVSNTSNPGQVIRREADVARPKEILWLFYGCGAQLCVSAAYFGYTIVVSATFNGLMWWPIAVGVALGVSAIVWGEANKDGAAKEVLAGLMEYDDEYTYIEHGRRLVVDAMSRKVAILDFSDRNRVQATCYPGSEVDSDFHHILAKTKVYHEKVKSGTYTSRVVGGLVGGVPGAIIGEAMTSEYKEVQGDTESKACRLKIVVADDDGEKSYTFVNRFEDPIDLKEAMKDGDCKKMEKIDQVIKSFRRESSE